MQSILANHMRQYYGIELRQEVAANKSIETELKRSKQLELNKVRLLVLGTGDSGKSTFIKQMVIKNAQAGHPFTPEQLQKCVPHHELLLTLRYKQALQRNLLETSQTLLQHTDLDEAEQSLKDLAEGILDLPPNNFELTPELAEEILTVWRSEPVQATFRRRVLIHVSFMNNTPRFAEEDFLPNVTDIVHCREITRGVKETKVTSPDGHETIFIDVGGQKSERRKWLHIFDNCTAIIYVVALNGYSQVLEEDDETNRFLDSLNTLEEVSKNPSLTNIPFMIFLNKQDLFLQKLTEVPITKCYPDFEDLGDLTDTDGAIEFLKDKVRAAFKGKHMYPPHVTCAIDTDDILKVWDACEEILRNSEEEFSNRHFI